MQKQELIEAAKNRKIVITAHHEDDKHFAATGFSEPHGEKCQAAIITKKRGKKITSARAYAMQTNCWLRNQGMKI